MVVISDTSPLTALLQAGREQLLQALFVRVVVPPAVQRELLRAHTSLPPWLEVIAPIEVPASVSSSGLDAGETEAIALALELHPDVLLMDERLGRRLAQQHGLPVAGLLGLVVLAKQRRLIDEVAPVVRELQLKGGCWFGRELLVEICRSLGERWE
jgi:predicted nucleic acid-binding protein